MEVLLMADSTTGTIENLALVMANLSHSIEELKATIASLNSTIDSLKAENECEPKLLEDISYTRTKKKQKGKIDIKLDNLKHVKKVYDILSKHRTLLSTNNPDITPVNKPQYCPYIVPAIAVSITSILGETPAIRKCLNNVVCSINPTIIITNILT
jgi:regulator of replication initiation timing